MIDKSEKAVKFILIIFFCHIKLSKTILNKIYIIDHQFEFVADLFGSLLKKEIYGYQNSYKKPKLQEIFSQNNYNYLPISPFQTQDIFSQNSSQPMMLPAGTLLSNYSSEYDRAYTKSDLKPNSYRNFYSTSHNETLKSQFDQVIPPGLSMKEFFEAKDKSFKRVRSDVKRKVSKILDFLEKDVED